MRAGGRDGRLALPEGGGGDGGGGDGGGGGEFGTVIQNDLVMAGGEHPYVLHPHSMT